MHRAFAEHEKIEESRRGAEPVRYVQVSFHQPTTSQGRRYPWTLAVTVREGVLPEWLAPYFVDGFGGPRLRRIERPGQGLGFVTPGYTDAAAAPGVYVARQPGDGETLRRSLMRDARGAGWTVDAWGQRPLLQVDISRPATRP
jgi:hypothetical protein